MVETDSDVNRYHDDLFKITTDRCTLRLKKMRQIMQSLDLLIPPEDVHFRLIGEREFMCYDLELSKRFKKKFPNTQYVSKRTGKKATNIEYLEAIFQAPTNDKYFLRIDEFDRACLYTDWA